MKRSLNTPTTSTTGGSCVVRRAAPFAAVCLSFLTALGSGFFPGLAVSECAAEEAPRYDEFGRVPADATDPDLTLPDPVLDRTWKGPAPGAPESAPKPAPRDEDSTDPFAEEPPRPAKPKVQREKEDFLPPPLPPAMPDGRPDPGNVPAKDSEEIDSPLGDDVDPSPLDQEEMHYERESSDPGEW